MASSSCSPIPVGKDAKIRQIRSNIISPVYDSTIHEKNAQAEGYLSTIAYGLSTAVRKNKKEGDGKTAPDKGMLAIQQLCSAVSIGCGLEENDEQTLYSLAKGISVKKVNKRLLVFLCKLTERHIYIFKFSGRNSDLRGMFAFPYGDKSIRYPLFILKLHDIYMAILPDGRNTSLAKRVVHAKELVTVVTALSGGEELTLDRRTGFLYTICRECSNCTTMCHNYVNRAERSAYETQLAYQNVVGEVGDACTKEAMNAVEILRLGLHDDENYLESFINILKNTINLDKEEGLRSLENFKNIVYSPFVDKYNIADDDLSARLCREVLDETPFFDQFSLINPPDHINSVSDLFSYLLTGTSNSSHLITYMVLRALLEEYTHPDEPDEAPLGKLGFLQNVQFENEDFVVVLKEFVQVLPGKGLYAGPINDGLKLFMYLVSRISFRNVYVVRLRAANHQFGTLVHPRKYQIRRIGFTTETREPIVLCLMDCVVEENLLIMKQHKICRERIPSAYVECIPELLYEMQGEDHVFIEQQYDVVMDADKLLKIGTCLDAKIKEFTSEKCVEGANMLEAANLSMKTRQMLGFVCMEPFNITTVAHSEHKIINFIQESTLKISLKKIAISPCHSKALVSEMDYGCRFNLKKYIGICKTDYKNNKRDKYAKALYLQEQLAMNTCQSFREYVVQNRIRLTYESQQLNEITSYITRTCLLLHGGMIVEGTHKTFLNRLLHNFGPGQLILFIIPAYQHKHLSKRLYELAKELNKNPMTRKFYMCVEYMAKEFPLVKVAVLQPAATIFLDSSAWVQGFSCGYTLYGRGDLILDQFFELKSKMKTCECHNKADILSLIEANEPKDLQTRQTFLSVPEREGVAHGYSVNIDLDNDFDQHNSSTTSVENIVPSIGLDTDSMEIGEPVLAIVKQEIDEQYLIDMNSSSDSNTTTILTRSAGQPRIGSPVSENDGTTDTNQTTTQPDLLKQASMKESAGIASPQSSIVQVRPTTIPLSPPSNPHDQNTSTSVVGNDDANDSNKTTTTQISHSSSPEGRKQTARKRSTVIASPQSSIVQVRPTTHPISPPSSHQDPNTSTSVVGNDNTNDTNKTTNNSTSNTSSPEGRKQTARKRTTVIASVKSSAQQNSPSSSHEDQNSPGELDEGLELGEGERSDYEDDEEYNDIEYDVGDEHDESNDDDDEDDDGDVSNDDDQHAASSFAGKAQAVLRLIGKPFRLHGMTLRSDSAGDSGVKTPAKRKSTAHQGDSKRRGRKSVEVNLRKFYPPGYINPENGKYVCGYRERYERRENECKKEYKTGRQWEHHRNTVHGHHRPFVCPKCEIKFGKDMEVDSLGRVTGIERTSDCEDGSKITGKVKRIVVRFFKKDDLTKHINTVHKKIRFFCPFCENRYSSRENLKRHILFQDNSCSHKRAKERAAKKKYKREFINRLVDSARGLTVKEQADIMAIRGVREHAFIPSVPNLDDEENFSEEEFSENDELKDRLRKKD